jgi:serine/threonine protein kinase/Tfp pilus assembly protein PilF
MPESQPVRFGKYILLDKIATGGMAQLFKAKIIGIEGFEKLIAIKQILPQFSKEKDLITSFIDEAKLAALLNHQNIVQIYDFGNIEDSYFISMEYLFGKDLRMMWTRLKDKELALPLEHALYITSRLCAGLAYAHELKDFQGKELNIIHRDISPQNVFVTYQGDVKILDFGIAKAASQSTVTQFGMIKGKVAYMSPEQAAGRPIDQRSDIFSAGIILYELVTNTRMFTGESTMQILTRVRDAQYDSAESLAGGLHSKVYAIINRALAKDPDQRYQFAADMLADIEECMMELSLRPTARILGQYMRELFADEVALEQKAASEGSGSQKIEMDAKETKTSKPDVAQPAAPDRPVQKEKEREREKAEEKKKEAAAPSVPAASREPAKEERRKKSWPLYAVLGVVIVLGALTFFFWPKAKSPVSEGTSASSTQTPTAVTTTTTANESNKTGADAAAPANKEDVAKAKSLLSQAAALGEKDPAQANGLLLQAIRLDPNSVQAHFQLGLTYVRLKDYSKAIETYQKVAAMDPQFPDIYFNLGFAQAMNKNYTKAEEMYDKVVKLSPKYLDEALFNLGMVQDKLGKKKESIANLERALSVNPKNTLVKEYLNRIKKR